MTGFSNPLPGLVNAGKKLLASFLSLRTRNNFLFWAIIALFVLVVVGGSALVAINFMHPYIGPESAVAMPVMLPTTTAYPMRQSQATPQFSPTPSPTATPIPSNLWEVNKLLGKQTINGCTALVVEFRNSTTGEIKNGQCQSPHDPAPKVGDIFVAEVKGDYILLSPTIPGTVLVDLDSVVQRFIFIP